MFGAIFYVFFLQTTMQSEFKIGDFVCEKTPGENKGAGTIVSIYDFEGDSRVVVQFEDGSEAVFFDFELVTTTNWMR